MILVEAKPMESASAFADRLLRMAHDANDVALGEFNQYTFEARPGMTVEDVLRAWNQAQKDSYFNV